MTRHTRLFALTAVTALTLGSAACTPAAETPAADTAATDTTRTIVETREVAAAPVVIEREVQTPPIIIERDRAREGDSTTVRAGRDGIEVETTNR